MLKRLLAVLLVVAVLMGSVLSVQAAPSGNYSEGLSIWPMNKNEGYWYTNEYSSYGLGSYMLLDSDARKYFNVEIENDVFRASKSEFAQDHRVYSGFIYSNQNMEVDLSKHNYLYYDFTAQNCMWQLTLTLSLAGDYNHDVTISLQKYICEQEKTANLTDRNQWGVRGVYQGRIDINKVIEDYGKEFFHNIDLKNKKIRVVRGHWYYFEGFGEDVLEMRYLGIGSGDLQFATPTGPLQEVKTEFKAENVVVKGKFNEGITVCNLIDPLYEWKTNISTSQMGAIDAETAYIDLDITDKAFTMKPSGQSIKDKAYIKGAVVGWPKLTATIPTNRFFTEGTYLVYDFTADVSWDIIISFNTYHQISLFDILNNITEDNSLDFTTRPNGTRAYGAPGKYKGVLDLNQILLHYLVKTGFQPVTSKYANLTDITFIYENCNDKNLSKKNTIRTLKIVRETNDGDIANVMDTEALTTGVYKPAEYVMPQFPTTPVFEYDAEAEAAAKAEEKAKLEEDIQVDAEEKESSDNGIFVWIIVAVAAVLLAVAAVIVLLIIMKKKKVLSNKKSGKDEN